MKITIAFATLCLSLHLSAAVPVRWTVETSRVQPAQIEAYHGETLRFEAALHSYGKPFAPTNNLVAIYWQTNGMDTAYWTGPAVISNNVLLAEWVPAMDVGATVYQGFIGAPGEIYRASFQLRLRPSPGAVPSELPLPAKVIDFAQVDVRNAPWLTVEADPTVPSWAKSPTKPTYTAQDVGAYAINSTIRINGSPLPYGTVGYVELSTAGIDIKPNEVGGSSGRGWLRYNELQLGGNGDARTGDSFAIRNSAGRFAFEIDPAVGGAFTVMTPNHGGTLALTSDIPAPFEPDPTDETFSNAVLAVGLNINTNSVAQISAILDDLGGVPIEGAATTVGGLLIALAAAVAWLKRNKANTSDFAISGMADYVQTAFSASNGNLTDTIKDVAAPKEDSDGNFYFEVED